MDINKNNPIPLHYQLTNGLRQIIKSGKWKVGDLFPTDRELMEKYEVSSTTVRRAVAQLVEEGWLERRPGKGTFLKKEVIKEDLGRLTGFFEEMRMHGFTPQAEVLNTSSVQITPEILKKTPRLNIFGSEQLYLIEKIQKFNDQPVAYVRSYWPYKYGKQIAEFDLCNLGLYEIAARELGVSLTKAEQTIGAGVARSKVAKLLQVSMNFPLLIMERVAYVEEDPVELSINFYRADRYKYNIVLYQNNPSGAIISF